MNSNNINFSANQQLNLDIQNFAFSEKLLVKMPSLNCIKVSPQKKKKKLKQQSPPFLKTKG